MAMLYDMGVDGMISDKAWILRSFLEKRGAKLRPTRQFESEYHLDKDHQDTPKTRRFKAVSTQLIDSPFTDKGRSLARPAFLWNRMYPASFIQKMRCPQAPHFPFS